MIGSWRLVLVVGMALGGCTGLQQFPDTSKDYTEALTTLDPNYKRDLERIYAGDATPKRIRNQFIETRLAVLDEHFRIFVAGLTKGHL